jgi:OOP family OmpA-OmpF porin
MLKAHKLKCSRLAAALVAVTLTLAWGVADSADGGWYLGAGGGQTKMTEPAEALSGNSFDDKDTAWKAFVGYQFHSPIALELGYIDFGQFTGELPIVGVVDTWKATGAFLNLVIGLPFNNQFGVFAKAGAHRWRVDDTTALVGSERREGTDPVFGIGAQFDFTKNLGARIEWERYRQVGDEHGTGRSDLDVASASVVLRFR